MSTSKPLTIYIHPKLILEPWVATLQAAGHIVSTSLAYWDEADLILGPTCARFLPGMEKYLDSFLKGARKVKYPTKEKKHDQA